MIKINIKKTLKETRGEKGVQYEKDVHAALVAANIPDLEPGEKPTGGLSNVSDGDIEATFKGERFFIEVKLDKNAQMGNGQVRYDAETGLVSPHSNMLKESSPDDIEILLEAARQKIPDYKKYLDRFSEITGQSGKGFPLRVQKEVREQLKNEGFLKATNARVAGDTRYIIKHYNKKGVYYIQIGGLGLFYMGKNPLNLPVPAFEGKAQVEMRLKPAGSKAVKRDGGKRFSNMEWVLVGRFLANVKSPYTLDDPESIKKLFGVPATQEPAQTPEAPKPQEPETPQV